MQLELLRKLPYDRLTFFNFYAKHVPNTIDIIYLYVFSDMGIFSVDKNFTDLLCLLRFRSQTTNC